MSTFVKILAVILLGESGIIRMTVSALYILGLWMMLKKSGVKSWWAFLIVGLLAAGGSLFVKNTYLSIFLGIFAFSSLWGIGEVFHQRERVRKGWFPMNPKRKNEY